MKVTNTEAPARNEIGISYCKHLVKPENTNKITSHPYSEIMIINQGDIVYTTGGRMVRLSNKSVIYNPEGMIHNNFVQPKRIYERYKIIFHADDLTQIASDILSTPFTKELKSDDFALIFECAKSMYGLIDKSDEADFTDIRIQNLLTLIMLNSICANDRGDIKNEMYIINVIKYINDRLSEKITIDDIASAFFVSRSKLIYDFTSYCDLSINEYIKMARLEMAKSLLIKGYSISYVAENCGFSSPSYFIKVFSSVVGVTPLKYQINKR